jgi:hypothetical protein
VLAFVVHSAAPVVGDRRFWFRGVPGLVGDTARRHIERSPKNDPKFAQRPPVNGRFVDGLFVLSGGGTSYEICPIVPDRPDLLLKILEL